MLSVSPCHFNGRSLILGLFPQSIISMVGSSAISYGRLVNLLLESFNIRKLDMRDRLSGRASMEFSDRISSSSCSSCPTSSGIFFSLLLFSNNLFSRFSRPISRGIRTILLNEAIISLYIDERNLQYSWFYVRMMDRVYLNIIISPI